MLRYVIVNADDFGQTSGINRGVIETVECGIVTSASLMVRWAAAGEAAAYARRHPALSVGLHVDLGEWYYGHGEWIALYERVDRRNGDAVESEIQQQLDRCCELLGRTPTHLDSHQHVHWTEPTRSILTDLAMRLRVPLRHLDPAIRHCGDFYGQTAQGEPLHDRVSAGALTALLDRLPDGVTEVACHPGYGEGLQSMYVAERTLELRALCASEVRQAVTGRDLRLISFGEVERE
jgi:predicted glycoside hydrolase/deacetylase ChbG (UPF0249 family)